MKKILYKDGSFLTVKDEDVWQYANDPDFQRVEEIASTNSRFLAVPLRKREFIVFQVGEHKVKISLHSKTKVHTVTAVIDCPLDISPYREPNPLYLSREDSLSLSDDKKT